MSPARWIRIPGVALVLLCAAGPATGPARAQEDPSGKERLPRLEKTGVLVPWEDFKKILEEIRAAQITPPPPPPPVDYALSPCQAAVSIDPGGSRALVRLEFAVEVLARDRWAEVPVIADGVALSRFDIDGRPANVYRKGGYHQVALRGEGRHTLVLEYLTAVTDNRGAHTASLRFPQAPVVALDMVVPRPRLDFSLPGAVIRSIESAGSQSRVRAAYQHTADAPVSWFRQVEQDAKETKVFGEVRTLLSIGDGVVRGASVAALTVHGRGIDLVRMALPDGLNVLDVQAQGMRDWSVESAVPPGAGRVLAVRLTYLAQGSYEIRIAFEQELPGGGAAEAKPAASQAAGASGSAMLAVPAPALLGVIRDRGFIAVAAASNVEITPEGVPGNATPVDPAELPPDLAAMAGQPVLYGFKYLRHPVVIGLKVVRHDDLAVKRTIVESARLFTYVSPDGHLITSARYTIKNNRKQYLELALPEGAEPWGAYLEERPVKAARNSAGRVLVPLKKTAADAAGDLLPFDVELVYFQQQAEGIWGRRHFRAPTLDVDALEVQWHLFLPRDRRYGRFDGSLRPDDQLNRIVYLERGAYNLRSRRDATELNAALERPEGARESDRQALRDLRASGLLGDKLAGADKDRADDEAVATGDDSGRANEKVDRLESDMKKVVAEPRRSDLPGPVPASPPPAQFAAPQSVTQAWRGGGAEGFAAAGLVRGVLPVRFSIPADGLRLSFAGRLITATEQASVSMMSWPIGWRLSRPAVLLLAALLTLVIMMMRAGEPGPGSRLTQRTRLALSIAAAVALFALFVLCPQARGAFWIGLALAVAGLITWRVVAARGAALALLLALVSVLAAPPAAASEVAADRSRLPDLPNTEITLPWKDFKALVEKTFAPPVVEPPPPSEAFLRSAEYTGRLDIGVLTLDGTLALEVLKKGWIRLPLVADGTVLSFQGGGAFLSRDNGRVEVLARGPASYALRVTFAFGATGNPGENRLSVSLPDAPRNLLNLAAAPAIKDLQVESGLAYGGQKGRLFVALPRGGLALKYTLPFRRAEERAGEEVRLEPRVQVESYQLLRLGDGVVGGALIHDYTVRVAKVDHFDIDLPEGPVIFDATAPGLESWKILERKGRRFLRIKLLAPVEGRVRAVVSFEGAYDPRTGRLAVPRFAPLEVERESGFVAVAADGAEVDLALTGRLLPADVSEMPPDVQAFGGSLIAACKYSGAPDAATVTIAEHEDAPVLTAIIESLNATAALLEGGTEATWVDLSVRNNRKQFLSLTLPDEKVEIWSLLLDGQPAKPKRTGGTVLVPLPRGDGERTARVSVVLLRKGPPVRLFGRIEPRLPRFDVPVSEALWTVFLPEGRRYVVSGGAFRPVIESAPLFAGAGFAGGRAAIGGMAGAPAPASQAEILRDSADSVAERSDAPAVAPGEAKEELYGAVSKSLARAQIDQEGRFAQQVRQKAAARKGTLPVYIAIPGGVGRLPRVTVSRMLIVGDEDNVFSVRSYPAWLGALLRMAQPMCLLAAGILLGLALAGAHNRRRALRAGIAAALLGVIPWGGLAMTTAILWIATVAGITWGVLMLYPWLRRRLRPVTT